jgi:Protein of unknown function (DUF3987)
MFGLSGEIVQVVGPHTEADPAGLVLQNLVAFGNVVGNGPHFKVEADRHACNVFLAEVGSSAKARKGTGWGYVSGLYRQIDPNWLQSRVRTGLRTGEGLVRAICDESESGPGEADKRLLALETEMSALLRVMARRDNTLSTTLRQAWDGGNLSVLTRQSPLKATQPHISIIAQTTSDDLAQYLHSTDIFNGFANRFLWACVRRSKLLPEGGKIPGHQFRSLVLQAKDAVKFAKTVSEIGLNSSASELWRSEYPRLTADTPGMLGAATSRAESQVRRIATIYALMDERDEVRGEHLRAALAVWEFCFESARYIFGSRSNSSLSQKLLQLLENKPAGLTRTEISSALNHHARGDAIDSALDTLRNQGVAKSEKRTTRGRSAERWFAAARNDE